MEHSYTLWLGDFAGGALLFHDGTRIEEKRKWHKIDGQIHHWNEPRENTTYSAIISRGSEKKKKSDLIHERIQQKKEKEEVTPERCIDAKVPAIEQC